MSMPSSPPPAPPARLSGVTLAVTAVVVLAVIFFFGIRPRLHARDELKDRMAAAAHPIVEVLVAKRSTVPSQITLPAEIQAFQDTPIYARTTGYIAKWNVDIGDRVKAGQVLAVIDTPDLDQELNQAAAALTQAKANLAIAKISADRWKDLGSQNAVAQQDVDQKQADYAGGQAAVQAAQANVDRLTQLKDYQHVQAPYDGVITARNAQIGALINAGSGTEIFHLAQTDTLRVYVHVPQAYFRAVAVGLEATVLVPEFPGQSFKGRVMRFAGSLDGASRTLLTEVELPNPRGELLPGTFGEVRFAFTAPQPAVLLPSNAAIINAAGTQVATVDDKARIHLLPVKLGRDFGTQIEVLEGLAPGTRVVAKPNDALSEGLEVEVHEFGAVKP